MLNDKSTGSKSLVLQFLAVTMRESYLQNFGFYIFYVRVHYIESLKDIPKFKMGHLNGNNCYFCLVVR